MRRALNGLKVMTRRILGDRLASRVRHAPMRAIVAVLRAPVARPVLSFFGAVPFNPFDPAFNADPYPFLHRLRARDPIHKSVFGPWLLTRYDDAIAVLADQRFVHPEYRAAVRAERAPGHVRLVNSDMLTALNPPDHTRLRRLLGEAFSARVGPALRPRIEAIAHQLIDRVADHGHMNAVTDFALPLPVTVIGEIFGMPPEDSLRCSTWVREGADALGFGPRFAQVARADAVTGELREFFTALIRRRRAQPGTDFVSALVRAQALEPAFNDAELVANCILFFGAGYETTVAFIGTALYTLMHHRGVWEQLVGDPAVIGRCVDELLRLEPPLQFFGRQAREDVVLRGTRIPRGGAVLVLTGAVNRDPARFADPDRLDVNRRDSQHATFGHGIHACLGRSLARLEGQVALEVLTRRLPGLRRGPEPVVWRPNSLFRGLDVLPVEW